MMVASPLRVLIVDDEPVARAGVRTLVGGDAECQVVGEASDGRAALAAIAELQPDLVLLDVQMPELNGFDVVRAIPMSEMPLIVFTTAYDEFALDAFDVNAVDYVLKPFDDDRFAMALARAKQAHRNAEAGEMRERLSGLLRHTDVGADGVAERLMVKTTSRVYFLRIAEIDWIEAADYCVKVHIGPDVHVIRRTLESLGQVLNPGRFVRVHRSAIVNVDRIDEIRPHSRRVSLLMLRDGTRLRLSHSRRHLLESRLER